MAVRVSIPVTSAGGADQVRVWYAVTQDDSAAPSSGSARWQTVAVVQAADIPTTVQTPLVPRGVIVWTRASGEDSNGVRITNYSTPVATLVPSLPSLAGLSLTIEPDGTPTLAWALDLVGNEVEGLLIEWGTAITGETVSIGDSVEVVASSPRTYEFDALARGSTLTVQVTPYSGWDGSGVYGDYGDTVTLSIARALPGVGETDVRTETGYEYTLTLADAYAHLRLSDPSGVTLIVPANADVALGIGVSIWIEQLSAGPVEITPASGVTISTLDGVGVTTGEHAVATLRKVAADEWVAWGDLMS